MFSFNSSIQVGPFIFGLCYVSVEDYDDNFLAILIQIRILFPQPIESILLLKFRMIDQKFICKVMWVKQWMHAVIMSIVYQVQMNLSHVAFHYCIVHAVVNRIRNHLLDHWFYIQVYFMLLWLLIFNGSKCNSIGSLKLLL